MLPLPLNFQRWIDEHRHLLKPPVGNKVIWRDGEFICMVVGGPNSRTDFHIEDGAEFFYQLEGQMTLRVAEEADGRTVIRDIPIRAGEIFLLPPRVPHSPQREAGSVGLVIERQRRPGELDALCWFCPNCQHRIYEERFELADIETQFPAVFDRFDADIAHRTCERCGTVHPKRRG
jgi:3-hydroxyanthranilate 3,4-dioxygenase